MDGRLADLLDELYRRGREHDGAKADRLDRWRNVEPDTARLMAVLVRALAPSPPEPGQRSPTRAKSPSSARSSPMMSGAARPWHQPEPERS